MKRAAIIADSPEEMIQKLDQLILHLITERIVAKVKFDNLPWYKKPFKRSRATKEINSIQAKIKRLNELVVQVTKDRMKQRPAPFNIRLCDN